MAANMAKTANTANTANAAKTANGAKAAYAASMANTANMANLAKTEQIDYGAYKLTAPETVLASVISMGLVFCAAFVFYRSFAASALLSPLGLLYLPRRRRAQIAKRREQLKQQFRDMLYSLSSSLMAGKTMESALREARGDMEIMYPDPETLLLREIDAMLRKASMNESIESALADLADRSGIEDIESFSSVISICRKTGGNLVEIVKNTTNILGDKLEIKNEIDILLAQRKFEKKVLNAMPIVLVLVLSAAAGEYIEPVFTTMVGRAVMSAAIALIMLSWAVSAKIMNISV